MRSGAPVALLSEMEAKQMGARPMASSQVVAQKKDVLYEVSWQCEMVVPSSAAPLERRELSSFTVLLEQDNSAIGVEMHPSLGVMR